MAFLMQQYFCVPSQMFEYLNRKLEYTLWDTVYIQGLLLVFENTE